MKNRKYLLIALLFTVAMGLAKPSPDGSMTVREVEKTALFCARGSVDTYIQGNFGFVPEAGREFKIPYSTIPEELFSNCSKFSLADDCKSKDKSGKYTCTQLENFPGKIICGTIFVIIAFKHNHGNLSRFCRLNI